MIVDEIIFMTKDNKNKVIRFRCTEDEYDIIMSRASEQGFKSISEFARFTMTRDVDFNPSDLRQIWADLNDSLVQLSRKITLTGSTIFQATRRLTTVNNRGDVVEAEDASNTRIALSQAPEALKQYQKTLLKIEKLTDTIEDDRKVLGRR